MNLKSAVFATISKMLLPVLETFVDKMETQDCCSAHPQNLMTNSDETVKATHVLSRCACHKDCHLAIVCSHSSNRQMSE